MRIRPTQREELAFYVARELNVPPRRRWHGYVPPGATRIDGAPMREQRSRSGIPDIFPGPRNVVIPSAHHVIHLVAEVTNLPESVAWKR